jgi:hypothetical protein
VLEEIVDSVLLETGWTADADELVEGMIGRLSRPGDVVRVDVENAVRMGLARVVCERKLGAVVG